MLYVIGLGLSSERDITVEALEVIKHCQSVYLEHYTSILNVDSAKLEQFYGRSVVLLDREAVECDCDRFLKEAKDADVAFLVVGDPLGATTHSDLILRAHKSGVRYRLIHNASIYNAIAACGLQLYSFGQTVSIPFFTDSWKPMSFYDRIGENHVGGRTHTLCLLDIKVKEISEENLVRGINRYDPPRYMSVNCAIEQLLATERARGEGVLSPEMLAVGVARIGSVDQTIKSGTLEQLKGEEFGAPLHSLVLIGRHPHVMELEFVCEFAVDKNSFKKIAERDYGCTW